MFSFSTILFVICTAYTAAFDECGKTDAITASGVRAIQGVTVACDGLPFGTEVVIDEHTYIVQDRFGGNYGKSKIDIYMYKKEDALKFGRQVKIVEVKDNATKTTAAERSLFDAQGRESYFPYR